MRFGFFKLSRFLESLAIIFFVSICGGNLVFATTVCTDYTGTNQSVIPDAHGIRIIFYDAEFYFNATNGGEITEYYDLSVDPQRLRNLANISIPGDLMGNLWPLFTSALYSPYVHSDYTTGGDSNATVNLVDADTNDHIILYTTSRMMNRLGSVMRDSSGSPVYINTTWIFNKRTGLISVERTFSSSSSLHLPAGWRWYPFYLTRNNGFDYNGTFYMFNTRSAKTVIVNDELYVNSYDLFPTFPDDPNGVFGIAMPFSNTSIEGDGTHNVIIIYNYNGLVDVSEWKSDTYNGERHSITECGAVHEFNTAYNVSAHTYHVVLHFTHQPVNEYNVIKYARKQSPTAGFDTRAPANPYPSIFGTHKGTITPNQTITVSKLYIYPCSGTGGHLEYVRIWNKTWGDVEAHWNGYVGDWHNITFDPMFTILANHTYNYTVITGSYPQIHHDTTLTVSDGEITCAEFTDANGKTYNNWIPAIRYAGYVDSQFPLIEVNLITDNDTYHPGDSYTISASGISHHNLSNLTSKFTAANDTGVYFEREYGPHNYKKGETFSMVLFSGHIPITESPGNRTFTIQLLSPTGAIIASDSKAIFIV
jgi:hypothetical protein